MMMMMFRTQDNSKPQNPSHKHLDSTNNVDTFNDIDEDNVF